MTVTCPAGHESNTADYCDVCGAVIGPATPAPAAAPGTEAEDLTSPGPPAEASGPTCPNCGAGHEPGDAFCEVCGLDFATGELPQPPPPPEELEAEPAEGGGESWPTHEEAAPAEQEAGLPSPAPAAASTKTGWVIVIEPDPEWFERNEAEGATGEVTFPEETTPEAVELVGDEVLIGRRSDTRTAQPDIEVGDPGVSRRHAVLRRQPDDVDVWLITDEESTNGTWVDGAVDPIAAGEPVALADGSVIHLGAYTRLTLRKA